MAQGGWYPDPEGAPNKVRWWDSERGAWTGHTAIAGSVETNGPPGSHKQPRAPRDLGRFGPGIAALLVAALVVFVLSIADGNDGGGEPTAGPAPADPSESPSIGQLCANTQPSKPGTPVGPSPVGPRIVDPDAKLSYIQLSDPFRAWDQGTWSSSGGGLGEEFAMGQYFVTQQSTPGGGKYMATVLSGIVPAGSADDPRANIECAAKVIADDVRKRYYPQPNQRKELGTELLSVSGKPAYLTKFHLAFDEPGYTAKGELVAICVVEVPGGDLGAIYVSIPDTHEQYDGVVEKVVSSLQIAGG